MTYYDNPQVAYKYDKSPVTDADYAVDDYLHEHLEQFGFDILSEETESEPQTEKFWIIDPIDGTKGFVNKTGDFAVNVSLVDIHNNNIMGYIYSPTDDTMYSYDNTGAYKNDVQIRVKQISKEPSAVVSRTNFNENTRLLLEAMNIKKQHHVGSSLKFCLVADGVADYYIRNSSIMCWDVCAGIGLVKAAGGQAYNIDGSDIEYMPKSKIAKPFIVSGSI